ncbi:MAG: hypothetical protein PVJ57_13235 [Phycisphaerae bacterium]|jgi:hypothetical protein
MTRRTKRTNGRQHGQRSICAYGAILVLTLALLICTGCDDTIRQTVMQGALGVFEDSMSTVFSTVGGELNSAITDLGQSSSTTP